MATEVGLAMLLTTNVSVCEGMTVAVGNARLVNYMVREAGDMVHCGVSAKLTPSKLPQLPACVNMVNYAGNLILILPVGDRLSLIVILNVKVVTLLTVSLNLETLPLINVEAMGVKVWYPTCMG